MKNKMFLVTLLFLAGNFFGFSADIIYVQKDGSEKVVSVDDNANSIQIFEREGWHSVTIEGIEALKNLKRIELYPLPFMTDFSFLSLDYIEELYIGSHCVTINDFSFLNGMRGLKNLEVIDLRVSKDTEINLKNVGIDFSALKKLEKLTFTLALEDEVDSHDMYFVPKFKNVKGKPELDLSNELIKEFSKDDIKVLKQFSSVCLIGNPVLENETEMKKLAKAKITVK